jgi:hypothetical protein
MVISRNMTNETSSTRQRSTAAASRAAFSAHLRRSFDDAIGEKEGVVTFEGVPCPISKPSVYLLGDSNGGRPRSRFFAGTKPIRPVEDSSWQGKRRYRESRFDLEAAEEEEEGGGGRTQATRDT